MTAERRIVGFCRLALPERSEGEPGIGEIAGSAMIREVHVYGAVVGLDDDRRRHSQPGQARHGRSQHLGLGTRLVEEAATIARGAGFEDLAVISSVGTREYYRRLGFADGELYQHRSLRSEIS